MHKFMEFEEYRKHDATGLAALVANGEVTHADLLDAALARTEAVNDDLTAVVIAYPEALSRELPEGPFTGVPFLLKDLDAEHRDFPAHRIPPDAEHRA